MFFYVLVSDDISFLGIWFDGWKRKKFNYDRRIKVGGIKRNGRI